VGGSRMVCQPGTPSQRRPLSGLFSDGPLNVTVGIRSVLDRQSRGGQFY